MDNERTHTVKGTLRRPVTRRELLVGLVIGISGLATACSSTAAPSATQKPAEQPKPAATGAVTAPAAAATQAPAAKPTGGQLRIGLLLPYTGDLALLGEECFRGSEIARVMQNAQGGLLGKEIEFVKGDAVNANTGVSEANRLIANEKLTIIVGTYSSTLSHAASEVAERNKVIFWESGAIADAIVERGFKYLFRTCATGSSFGVVAANFTKDVLAVKLGTAADKVKVAVTHEDALYGTTVGTAAEKRSKEIGLSFVGREPYNSKATDLSSLILKLKGMQPDVLIATSYIQDLILFWKQARELDFNVKAAIGTGAGYSLTDFAKAMGSDVNGILNVDGTQFIVNPKFAKGMTDMMAKYKELFNEPPRSGHSLTYYGGLQFLFDVIKRAGSVDPEAVRKAALETDIPEGETPVGYGVKFAGPDQPNAGQNVRAYPLMFQWQNNEQVTIWPEAAATAQMTGIPWPTWSARKKS